MSASASASTLSASDTPAPLDATNTIDLVSIHHSKITNVSLYAGRAEITRLYHFTVKTGQNQVNIKGLPAAVDRPSLRVEGRGVATIHDVTVGYIQRPTVPSTSEALTSLLAQRNKKQKALERAQTSLGHLETYLESINAKDVGVEKLGSVMDEYDATGGRLDDRVALLEVEVNELDRQIKVERAQLSGPTEDARLTVKASVGVFAEIEGEVEIALIYAVIFASWNAGYDIRVSMQTKVNPVTLIYKAVITQNTGESWDDVPLTLETATPSFGLGVPTLSPQTLSIYTPPPPDLASEPNLSFGGGRKRGQARRSVGGKAARKQLAVPVQGDEEDEEDEMPLMSHAFSSVGSQGTVSATFRVPGLVSIPSDGAAHNFTITELALDAKMSWVVVPKVDATKTHLKARVKNESEYTLLKGSASVYVDGSFISRSVVPPSSPGESFDCPLGLDPSVRITYHPLVKKVSQTGFYSKSSNYIFTQRITVHNTKSIPVERLKVVDQIPVSEDSQIIVKLVNPALSTATNASSSAGAASTTTIKAAGSTFEAVASQVPVSEGVVAFWDGADEPGVDPDALGKDGKLNWVLNGVPAQGKVNLVLQWEVTTPLKANVVGL